MRFYILRALVTKEVQRHLANRGGIALALLLVAAAVLLSVFAPDEAAGAGGSAGGLVNGLHHCYVFYETETPLVRHLQAHHPDTVLMRRVRPDDVKGLVEATTGVGSITIQSGRDGTGRPVVSFDIWHPKDDPAAMAGYEQWFLREARRGLQAAAADRLRAAGVDPAALPPPPGDDDLWAVEESFRTLGDRAEALRPGAGKADPDRVVPAVTVRRQGLGGRVLDFRAAIATGMVVFALYFSCVYLLPTLNCEERERGVLLAQALSPASPFEIVAAKFLFYPTCGIALAAVLVAIYKYQVLGSLFFWLSLLAVGGGFLGIGMTVATLAKTQRAAFLGGMCYLLSVSLVLLVCAYNNIPLLPNLAVEYHGPRILHAALSGNVMYYHWYQLLAALVLAAAWLAAAGWLFRRRGWQ